MSTWNRSKKIIMGVAVVLIASFLLALFALYQFSAPQSKAPKERMVINLGTSEKELIHQLHIQGYIRSPWAFNMVLTIKGWHGKIEPGGYLISKAMSAWTLADTLVNHPYQRWVLLPEGLRVEELAEILGSKLRWGEEQKSDFLNFAQEGYMFPDTYLLNLDYSGKEVAQRLMSNFNEKVRELFLEAQQANIRNDTLIILASLVQRETASEEEMPLISGIIWNRWLKGMRFEIDATVQYALGEEGNWWPMVKPEDYKVDSPYNTYLYEGRPPAPICSPGLAAIRAVIYPEETEYLYFLHDQGGKIHPARTYEQHLQNIEKYLK
ncbi:MAG: Endolytic murein transglycosylase [Actinobacteria bacterium]|uniref:Endolytic murein transglycosylase n=1 Tax=Candidatus Hakubella thermalkaliphila TaxID=2754717 RepID=A0A6V8QA14_9ACTN|nr:endolytic transglycosylase MltG [Candidatus Hakubella thermalkaliphila]MBT9170962.1 Endolytic murein transglycosylase [Actinomycetota bacterium]GFP30135.1 UPF0755 protein [Candidatus Hakubella thermalkaliphila]GFP41423.1 UPF0755 protein [Candidatus Hakubella thermalkaliphila]